MHVPSPCVWKSFFRDNRNDGFFPGKPLAQLCIFSVAPSQRSSPQAISTVSCPSQRSSPQAIYFLRFPVHPRRTLAFTKLFPEFPVRPRCFLAPSQQSSPHVIFHDFLSVHDVHARFRLAPPAAKQPKREPKHRRCFWEKKTYKCW